MRQLNYPYSFFSMSFGKIPSRIMSIDAPFGIENAECGFFVLWMSLFFTFLPHRKTMRTNNNTVSKRNQYEQPPTCGLVTSLIQKINALTEQQNNVFFIVWDAVALQPQVLIDYMVGTQKLRT